MNKQKVFLHSKLLMVRSDPHWRRDNTYCEEVSKSWLELVFVRHVDVEEVVLFHLPSDGVKLALDLRYHWQEPWLQKVECPLLKILMFLLS